MGVLDYEMEDDELMEYQSLGDRALVIRYNNYDLQHCPDLVRIHFNCLREKLLRGIIDIVLCYSSIGVYYDNEVITRREVESEIRSVLDKSLTNHQSIGNKVVIPVHYGGKFGPDLATVSEYLNISAAEIVREHSSHKYTVFGIGFLPGFPYLGPLPQKLVIPRKTVPTPCVPAGSVAIAGEQTGIYPFSSPGGWHVIGWTPVKMFNVNQYSPAHLKPGDTVSFVPVSIEII